MSVQALAVCHYVDTGALYCLGVSEYFSDLYGQHFIAVAVTVQGVANEVSYRAQQKLSPGNRDRMNEVREAARKTHRVYRDFLSSALPRPAPVPDFLLDLEAEFRQRTIDKRGPVFQHPLAHRGESECIHAAVQIPGVFVTCDDDAGFVAEREGLKVNTFVDVAREMMAADPTLNRTIVAREVIKIMKFEIDVGEVFTGVLDL